MQPKEHANLLGIFFWIFAGLQALITLVWVLVAGFFGFAAFSIAQENRSGNGEATAFITVIVVVFALIALVALACATLNIFAGIGLRRQKSWARSVALIASITSIISSLFMGVWAIPIGLSVGIYGLWFILSDDGKFFFNNLSPVNQNQMLLNQSQMYTGQTYQYYNPNNYETFTPNKRDWR